MRIKARNNQGYLDVDVGDGIFAEFPGRSAHPVSYGRSGTVTTWSGGGVATIVPNGKTNHIDLNPLTNMENEESRMTFEIGKTYPGGTPSDEKGRYYWKVVDIQGNMMKVVSSDDPNGTNYDAVIREDGRYADMVFGGRTETISASILPENMRIRKLTPRECLRLMGYNDEEIDKVQQAVTTTTLKNGTVKTKPAFSNSAQYRFAGNSVVVDMFAGVLDCIVKDMETPNKGIDEW